MVFDSRFFKLLCSVWFFVGRFLQDPAGSKVIVADVVDRHFSTMFLHSCSLLGRTQFVLSAET